MSLFNPDIVENKINNLTIDESSSIFPYLSRDDAKKREQIKFINSNTNINRSISASKFNQDEIAKSISDLSKINSLTPLLAKTTVAANGYFDKATDALGTTILNAIDSLVNDASDGLNSMVSKIEQYANKAVDAERKFTDKTTGPVGSWATKKLKSFSNDFVDDLHSFNQAIAKNRLLNLPGDVFNSTRHILFALKGDLEKLVDFVHQIFAGISAAILKLKRLINRTITALVKILVNLIENLIPTEFLTQLSEGINTLLLGLGESIGTFINTAGLETTTNLFQGLTEEITSFAKEPLTYMFGQLNLQTYMNVPALNNLSSIEKKLTDPLTSLLKLTDKFTIENLIKMLPKDTQKFLAIVNQIATNSKGFVGNGVRSWARKHILKNKTSLLLGKTNALGIKFTLSTPQHYSDPTSYNSTAPYIVFKRLLTDNSNIVVDSAGNRYNYLSYTNTHLF